MRQAIGSLLFGLAAGLAAALAVGVAAWAGGATHLAIWPVVAAFVLGMAFVHYWKTLHFKALRDSTRQVIRRLDLLQDQISETQGLVQLTRFDDRYPMPFGGGWALTADAAVILVREIALRRPGTVVELGSGVSTLLIGRMLKEFGEGKLYSLDHDAEWAARTRAHVRASGLEDHVVVLDAPLSRQRFDDDEYDWYSLPDEVRRLAGIDLLVVDGPPQSLSPSGIPRYPAFPAFAGQLSSDGLVYVDDAKRPQEQRMISQWMEKDRTLHSLLYQTTPGTCLLYWKR
jgi:hypothetical protein